MSGTGVKAIQLLVSLSLLIVLHEFGHFFFARLFKTRVEKFYLFFDFLFPFSGLLNFSIFKKKKGDTEYGIGWFPLGGYVKIAGMVDESMDKEQMAKPPEPWEYRSKKAYQRLFIMLGGIIVNVLLAMILYMAIFGIYGDEYLPVANMKYGIMTDSLAQSMGLRNGDMIVSVDHNPETRFNTFRSDFFFHKDKGSVEVSRNGRDTSLPIPLGLVGQILEDEKANFIRARVPAVIDTILPGTLASRVKMQKYDSIISVNGQPVYFFDEFDAVKKANSGKELNIAFVRNGTVQNIALTIPKDSAFGIFSPSYQRYFQDTTIHYNPIQAVRRGFGYTFEQFGAYIRQFKLFRHEVKISNGVGGIGSFGKMFPSEFDMEEFLKLTALVSIILAFMNLLPIPGLDGGYVMFLLYEMITGKQVSEKVMERATTVGLVILLTVMLYANGMDVFKWLKH